MADDFLRIDLEGIDKVMDAFTRFPKQIGRYLGAAGEEAARRVIFPTVGLKRYPPGVPGAPKAQNWTEKQRKFFFAALREGRIEVPYRRGQSPGSERYGTQWYAKALRGGFQTEIGNRASYAKWLAGPQQSRYMANRGWRKLVEAAQEKRVNITRVYQAWVDKLLRDLGL